MRVVSLERCSGRRAQETQKSREDKLKAYTQVPTIAYTARVGEDSGTVTWPCGSRT